MLIRNGADIWAKSKAGMGAMHIAAQGNNAMSLTYFRDKGLSVNERDNQDNTPLHHALYKQAPHSRYYLLGWPATNINAQNTNKIAALHIAVQ